MRHLMPLLAAAATVLSAAPAWGQCTANELVKLTASDAAPGDAFGVAVAVSPDGVGVIGAVRDDDVGTDSGSAYVFRYNGTSWIEEAKLTASDGAAVDRFGLSVAIGGDVIVIGAFFDDDACPKDPLCNSGSAYVYRYDGTDWIEEAKLTASDADEYDLFGGSVAISGGVVVIGAPADDIGKVRNAGSAYVFRYNGTSWIEEAKLTASDGTLADEFGGSVSMNGDFAVVGARADSDAGLHSGSAYVYQFDPETSGWIEKAKLLASDPVAWDFFGYSVALSGDVAVIGTKPWYDNPGPGSAYVFQQPDGGWVNMTETAKLTASDAAWYDQFGRSVSISAEVILVGALRTDEDGANSGSAYVFKQPTGGWVDMTESAKLSASDSAENDAFGLSVSTSSGVALVGSGSTPGGSTYVFAGLSDCNDSGTLDLCDIANGTSGDTNDNGIPDECEPPDCPADLDGDGGVGILDLLSLLAAWGTNPGGPPDFDGDGTVGILDLLALLANWGPCA